MPPPCRICASDGSTPVRFIPSTRMKSPATSGSTDHDTCSRAPITEQSVWFITGCSTGFGRELAKQLLARGNRVVVTARNTQALTQFAGKENALVQKLDVTDPPRYRGGAHAAEAHFGRIDVLVNNAGIGYFAAVEEGEDTRSGGCSISTCSALLR
jgi:hypothetical protein